MEKVINGAIFLVANFICSKSPDPGDFISLSKEQLAAAMRIHRMELTFKHSIDIPKIQTGAKMAGLNKGGPQ